MYTGAVEGILRCTPDQVGASIPETIILSYSDAESGF
jgi:hypothetical protein